MTVSPAIRKHIALFIIVLLAVIMLDQAIAILTVNQGQPHPGPSWTWGATWFLPDSALNGAAAFNDTLSETWFAETMTFILGPLILIWLYRRLDMRFWIPWILTGIVALFGIWANIGHVYSQNGSVGPPQITEILHDGAYSPIHKNVNVDYMLESEFMEFMAAQLLFIVPFSLGYLALNIFRAQHIDFSFSQ